MKTCTPKTLLLQLAMMSNVALVSAGNLRTPSTHRPNTAQTTPKVQAAMASPELLLLQPTGSAVTVPVIASTSTSTTNPDPDPAATTATTSTSTSTSTSSALTPQASSEVTANSRPVHLLAADANADGTSLAELRALLAREPYMILARDEHGWTPLHEAARGGHIPTLAFLLDQGADLNALTYTGATPLYEAEKYHGIDAPAVRYLISQGGLRQAKLRGTAAAAMTRQDLQAQRIPHVMAAEGRIDELNQLVALRGDYVLTLLDANGWTPLHEAARFGHVTVARFLLEQHDVNVNVNMDVNALSNEGGTPLYYAEMVWGKSSEMVLFLEGKGGIMGALGGEPAPL